MRQANTDKFRLQRALASFTSQQIRDKYADILTGCISVYAPPGWLPYIDRALTKIKASHGQVQQIKQKFGCLVIYHHPKIDISEEVALANATCEFCENPSISDGMISGNKTCADCA